MADSRISATDSFDIRVLGKGSFTLTKGAGVSDSSTEQISLPNSNNLVVDVGVYISGGRYPLQHRIFNTSTGALEQAFTYYVGSGILQVQYKERTAGLIALASSFDFDYIVYGVNLDI